MKLIAIIEGMDLIRRLSTVMQRRMNDGKTDFDPRELGRENEALLNRLDAENELLDPPAGSVGGTD